LHMNFKSEISDRARQDKCLLPPPTLEITIRSSVKSSLLGVQDQDQDQVRSDDFAFGAWAVPHVSSPIISSSAITVYWAK
jgi:hypothetical protein